MADLKLYGKSKDDMEVLKSTGRMFADDINIKFGISKCSTLVIKKGKTVEDGRIQMHRGIAIGDLGVLKSDKIKM